MPAVLMFVLFLAIPQTIDGMVVHVQRYDTRKLLGYRRYG